MGQRFDSNSTGGKEWRQAFKSRALCSMVCFIGTMFLRPCGLFFSNGYILKEADSLKEVGSCGLKGTQGSPFSLPRRPPKGM